MAFGVGEWIVPAIVAADAAIVYLVGIDIDNASRKLNLRELTLSKLPTEIQTLSR